MFNRNKLFRMFFTVLVETLSGVLMPMLIPIMVSGIGEYAISATGLVSSLISVAVFFFVGVSTGAIVKVSQYFGANDMEACKKVARQAIMLEVTLATIVSIVMVVFGKSLVYTIFAGADAKILEEASKYVRITALSYPFYSLFSVSNGVIYGTGEFKRTLINSTLINVVNVAMCAVFIYVCKLGVSGAALSVVCSRAICGIYVYSLLCRGTKYIKIGSAFEKPDRKSIWAVLRVGVPTAIDNIILNCSGMAVQTCIVALGSVAIAANAIVTSLSGFLIIPGAALQTVSVTVIGQTFGAGDIKTCRKYMLRFIFVGMGVVALMCGLSAVISDSLINLYNPEKQETFALAKNVFITMVCLYPILWAPAFMPPTALRGCGDVKYSAVVSIFAMVVVRVATAYIFGITLGWGLVGVWLSMFVEWFTRAVLILPRIFSKKWERLDRV